MNAQAKQAIANIITVVAIGVLIFIGVILLARINGISKEIKDQTDINQRFLRCILLIERERFENPEARLTAIDTCTIESRNPAEPNQANNEDQSTNTRPEVEFREQDVAPQNQTSEPEQSTPEAQPQTTPEQTTTELPQTPPEPTPEPKEQSLLPAVEEPIIGCQFGICL